MKKTELNYQIALTLLKGIGPVKARHLLAKMEDLESIFNDSLSTISKKTNFELAFLKQIEREGALIEAQKQVENLEKMGVQSHFFTEKSYPQRLKQCSDAPLLLFSSGNTNLNAERIVAIVGTRHSTDYGKSVCEDLIGGLAGKNVLVISGMAYGIDICVHQLCVKNDIPTIGVLGHGLDRLYPREHESIAKRMLEKGGLLTEYLPGTNPDRENFPMRNRIVAGMSDATIVVESKDSGGSLITAELANDYARDVFAFPGNVGQIHSRGCNTLIAKQKAHLITGSKDFLNWMHWGKEKKQQVVQRALFSNFSSEEKTILNLLESDSEQSIDLLSIKAHFPVSKTNVLLFNLEMAGAIKMLPGKKYKLIT